MTNRELQKVFSVFAAAMLVTSLGACQPAKDYSSSSLLESAYVLEELSKEDAQNFTETASDAGYNTTTRQSENEIS